MAAIQHAQLASASSQLVARTSELAVSARKNVSEICAAVLVSVQWRLKLLIHL